VTANAFTEDTWAAYGEEPARLTPWSHMVVSPAMYEALMRYDEFVEQGQRAQRTLESLVNHPSYQRNKRPLLDAIVKEQSSWSHWPDMPWETYADPRMGKSPAAVALADWDAPTYRFAPVAYRHLRGYGTTEGLLLKMHLRDEMEKLWGEEVRRRVIGEVDPPGSNLRGILGDANECWERHLYAVTVPGACPVMKGVL